MTRSTDTFVGCGIVDPRSTPRAGRRHGSPAYSGRRPSVRFQPDPQIQPAGTAATDPYSRRDDIIVLSDEAHRTQAGKLARNMRLALPNAAFIGFTGTPLFKYDHLTRRIFGDYVSRYDFERSRQDGSTVKLVYENRGEKLGITRVDLNDRIAEKIEEADLDPDQLALLEKLLGKDYEVITADDRLKKLPTISWSTAPSAGSPASRCWSASTRSPAAGCTSSSSRGGRHKIRQLAGSRKSQGGGVRSGDRSGREGTHRRRTGSVARADRVDGDDHH